MLGLLNVIQDVGACGLSVRAVCLIFWGEYTRARFFIGMGLTFAQFSSTTSPARPTAHHSLWYSGNIPDDLRHVHYQQHLVLADPLDSAGIAECVADVSGLVRARVAWWLISKGRDAQMLHIFAYYHAAGDENHGLLKVGLRDAGEREARITVVLAFFSQWSGNGLLSYHLHVVLDEIGNTSPTIQLLISGIPAIWSLCWALLASSLVDRLGRRFLTNYTGMFIFFLAQTICIPQY
ncbi:hypothetical protein FIBSPDRAFT_1037104 [Athelia psychrophila]|uniref:Major facilitator superfamily (MFS) profile domain-containing protein n=1 Tax=Athelia psychrophila TaxID=1759441 RepID=A0A166USB6_9AGAM|nr:hypothetical protein FIBSPDRAFT_1037104 [Fibularhizoctonia sp. CBS 109695]